MSGPWSGHLAATLACLEQHGPMLAADIAAETGLTLNELTSVMRRATKRSTRLAKRVYILRWEYKVEGQRDYPRPVYALGSNKNAPKPARKHVNDIRRDYMRKRIALTRASSVFNLGLGYKQIERGLT